MTDLVTVIGGSGFLGRYVVQQLAKAGHRVRVAVRHPELALFLKPLGAVGQIQIVQANVRYPASIARAVAGASAVVNLVGILFPTGRQTFDRVQAEGAQCIAAAAAAAQVKTLVHVSAIGADAQSTAHYARTKGEGEAHVRAAFPAAVILRPSLVFGPEDGFFNRFAGLAQIAPVMPVICGDSRFQPVYVGDVAAAIAKAVDAPADFAGKTFELGGPHVWTFRDLLKYILKEIRIDRPLVDIPLPLARLKAAFLGLLPRPLLTLDQLKLLARDNVVSPGATGLKAFDIAPTPVEAIVPNYLVTYRPHGQFNRKTA
ncbi:MAG: complex I NDUFA9 subunit family protein [Sphingomonadales bacterium]|nr:MAG: complex I NDUFA9 subunit family protein [Sphingomonadales bacterium]